MKKKLILLLTVTLALLMVGCTQDTTYTVKFDARNGSAVTEVQVKEGQTITKPSNPKKDNYTFDDWYTTTNFASNDRFRFTTPVRSDLTLYANWLEEEQSKIDLNGIEFVIMVDNKDRANPRSASYERLFRNEKIERMDYVENKYNINIVYKNYPSNATWGGARERWIIEETTNGNPPHIFEVTSNSVGTLAQQKVITPLDDYIEMYGNKGFWNEKSLFSIVNGKNYGYDDQYTIADEGIYYNSDLLAAILGEENRNLPTEKWLAGTWTWEEFEKLAKNLNTRLDQNRTPENGGPQYVLGGRVYNWAYGMFGTNGGQLVSSDYKTHLTSAPVLETLEFLNGLYSEEGMWKGEAPLDNAAEPEFAQGNIVFHNGQSYWLMVSNKWLNTDFNIDFVPYPVGPRAEADKSQYRVNHVNGMPVHVISSFYDKNNIPAGYEDMMIHDETIFKIWADLQYFQDVDPLTGQSDIEPIKDDFYTTRLFSYYASEVSREAHLSIINLASPDFFYTVDEAKNHNDVAYMIKIQSAIRDGEIRGVMEATEVALRAVLIQKYKLPNNYYD